MNTVSAGPGAPGTYQTFKEANTPDVDVRNFAMKKELVGQVLGNFQASKMVVEGCRWHRWRCLTRLRLTGPRTGRDEVVLDIGAEHTDLIIIDQEIVAADVEHRGE